MKAAIYQGVKLAIGTTAALFIAEQLGLQYATTAGIIALLSILNTRTETYLVAMKRFLGSGIAMILAALLFEGLGHHLVSFGLFMMCFVGIAIVTNLQPSISVGTVLVTHIYTLQTIDSAIILNEVLLLSIGVAMGILLNLHMISEEKTIREAQRKTEAYIRQILYKMQGHLMNTCQLSEEPELLQKLDATIIQGASAAISYQQNNPLRSLNYYPAYFRMRREQYFMLKHMEKHFQRLFIAVEEAKLLSDFTGRIADDLNEYNDGKVLLNILEEMRIYYRQRPLPDTRETFENRATLYQYMNDLEQFIQYKANFMANYGEIHYIGKTRTMRSNKRV